MSSPKLPHVVELALPAELVATDPAAVSAVQDDVLRLYDECGPGVRRYVRSFGLTMEAADDVVQEVFLSLFKHLLLGRARTNLRGWIFRVGNRLAVKQRARTAVRQKREGELEAAFAESYPDPGADPEQQMADGQRRRRLQSVMRALPERDRQCLFLRAEGLRYREIACTLEVSLGSVAKSMARATARLIQVDEERPHA